MKPFRFSFGKINIISKTLLFFLPLLAFFINNCANLNSAPQDQEGVIFYPRDNTSVCPDEFGYDKAGNYRKGKKITCSATFDEVISGQVNGYSVHFNTQIVVTQDVWLNTNYCPLPEAFYWTDSQSSNVTSTIYEQQYDPIDFADKHYYGWFYIDCGVAKQQ